MENDKYYVGATPYDDVFRTLVTDCSQLVIPILNEAFGEQYTGNEKIEFGPNEHYLRQQDGQEQKRITDSSFRVIGKESKSYLLECQSTADDSMLVRIFEYVTQIALDESTIVENELIIEIPNAAILYLRSSKNTPDSMKITFRFPEESAQLTVPCLKVKNYTIEEIFEKGLYFLIPFYIFTYESRFKEIEENAEKLDQVKHEYEEIRKHLDEALQKGLIKEYAIKTVNEMSEKVLEAIAEKYSNIREGVKSVMGGQVLEYEAKRIMNEGRAEGRTEGRQEGKIELMIGLVQDGLITVVEACKRLNISEAKFKDEMKKATQTV